MRVALGLAAIVVLFGSPVSAMIASCRVEDIRGIPVARLIRNLDAYIAKHPDDALGPYTLGRLNYFAFVQRTTEFSPTTCGRNLGGDEDHVPFLRWVPPATPGHEATLEEMRGFLTQAIQNIRVAIRREPDQPLFWNTLASVFEQGAPFSREMIDTAGLPPDDQEIAVPLPEKKRLLDLVMKTTSEDAQVRAKARAALEGEGCPAATMLWKHFSGRADPLLDGLLERCWKERAIDAYDKAFALALKAGYREDPHSPPLAYEAGSAYVRLVRERGARATEVDHVAEVEKSVARIGDSPAIITPIVLSLESSSPLAGLVSSQLVTFDLDASGRHQKWTWLQPTTGLLVWDPRRTGHIESGHQLLGAVSFQMFWRNGYAALDALDDNRDGRLSGGELTGLAVWFDRNSNGVSDPGEVIPVEALGIVWLATEATGRDGESPMNARGVFLRDGRVLPTYDWIAHTVPEVAAR